jgi:hypothetical protein
MRLVQRRWVGLNDPKPNMKLHLVMLSALTGCLVACSSTQSTISNDGAAYALSREKAREIVNAGILANFSPDYVNPGPLDSLTSSGYIRFALDTHTITASAIPVKGYNSSGGLVDGYGFLVNSFGTMPISGSQRAKSVYNLLKQQASNSGERLRVR